jgi:hypothetical protein
MNGDIYWVYEVFLAGYTVVKYGTGFTWITPTKEKGSDLTDWGGRYSFVYKYLKARQ